MDNIISNLAKSVECVSTESHDELLFFFESIKDILKNHQESTISLEEMKVSMKKSSCDLFRYKTAISICELELSLNFDQTYNIDDLINLQEKAKLITGYLDDFKIKDFDQILLEGQTDYYRDLIETERCFSSFVYNKNIKNFGPNGIELKSGRSFNYPITYLDSYNLEQKIKNRYPLQGLSFEDIRCYISTGFYKFGANNFQFMQPLKGLMPIPKLTEDGFQ